MKLAIEPGASGNVLATIAIGDSYYRAWLEFAYPSWSEYCRRHDLGLVVFDDHLIPESHPYWKKPTWQKLLIPDVLASSVPAVRNVCYIDTDFLLNVTAPNVFDGQDTQAVGLVSLRQRLPYPHESVLRRLAFLRNRFYSASYPLDSALFISVERLYTHHGLTPQPDEACAGLLVFNVHAYRELMRSWFMRYDRQVSSITGGGDQTHVNHAIQSHGRVQWLDYRFQAIWAFEMAWKYPFLYRADFRDPVLIKACIESSLFTNYFLHFAGSWHESAMWTSAPVLSTPGEREWFDAFHAYCGTPVTGDPVGMIKPG